MLKNLLFIVALTVCSGHLIAQDIHLSHIHASPTLLNPAMVGMISNGDIRFIANSRSQWDSVTKGYKTVAGSVDAKLLPLGGNSVLGTGFRAFADKAGDLDFTTTSASLVLSVIRSLDRRGNNHISFGFENAFFNNKLDYSKMIGFEAEPLIEEGAPSFKKYWSVSAGFAYTYKTPADDDVYVGLSVFHLNQPNVSFLDEMEPASSEPKETSGKYLFRRVVVHGGANLRFNHFIGAMPSFIFMDQGPHREITAGTFIRFVKSASFHYTPYAFYIGAWARWYMEHDVFGTDALIAAVRMDIKKLYITFSFDFNISTLRRASYGLGGPEISIIQILPNDSSVIKSQSVQCPAF